MRRLGVGVVLLWLAGCQDPPYACHDDASCVNLGSQGTCVPAGTASFCAFPDSICPSGLRWDPSAPSSLAKNCVGRELDASAD